MHLKTMENKMNKKGHRKQKRAYHRLLRDMNIKCSDNPTKFIMICNSGLVTGFQREELQNIIDPLNIKYDLIMPINKSYCFIKLYSVEDATWVYNKIHGLAIVKEQSTVLYATFTETVPEVDYKDSSADFPPGLKIIENIITEEEEKMLLSTINWSGRESCDLKHRKVKHFGYEFQYGSNNIDLDKPIAPIPEDYQFLRVLFKKYHSVSYEYDQLTINHYLPGQGIPPHIDTHSVFEDSILSLSLGSAYIMDFKREDRKIAVLLPPRSLLIMSGEARYAWSHGICPRHNDVVKGLSGITTQPRGVRVSFTFRKVRKGNCLCSFPEYCDTSRNSTVVIDNTIAPRIEHAYVHEVYDQISNHFDETRHKQWPNVSKFLQSLNTGDILLDVGCGNGKYLYEEKRIFKVGCDRSQNLMKICYSKGLEVFLSDCLYLPYKDNSVDAVISIAVIHHLSTSERRKQAISELARVLRPNGRCLIYVWAKEQEKNSVKTVYLKYGSTENEASDSIKKITEYGISLPVHENRTNFKSTDMLVPWKRKGGGNFLRFYHVFEENELQQLCSEIPNITMTSVYYDQGNWCIILEKKG